MAGDEEDESFSLGSGRPHIDTTPRKPAPESDGSQADPATPDEKKEPEVRRAEPVTESEDALDHALRAQKRRTHNRRAEPQTAAASPDGFATAL